MFGRSTSLAILVSAFAFFGPLCLPGRACTDSSVEVWTTNRSCLSIGTLHVKYGPQVGQFTIFPSDAQGSWSWDSTHAAFYPQDDQGGEVTFSPIQWAQGSGGYIVVFSRPSNYDGCTDFKGWYNVSYQIIQLAPATDCPVFPPPSNDHYFLQFEIATDPASPYIVEKEIPSTRVVNAQLSLGTIFSPKIVKKHTVGGISTVVPVVSAYSQPLNQVAPLLETEYNLWDNRTTISLSDGASAGTTLKYAAVHLGKTDFVMLPASESFPAVTLHLDIVRPPALGGTHNEWDPKFIDGAHERGIPPQFLKAQARQESNFNESEFRYEPCTADLTYISQGDTLIDESPYNLYRMDAPALDDRGLTGTVNLRNKFYIVDSTGTRRKLTHDDRGVTAGDIWYANDKWPPDKPGAHGQNWSTNPCPALKIFLRNHLRSEIPTGLLAFPAQTPTSSSYGLLQVMYATALQYRWSVADPENPGQDSHSPRYLRDTPESLSLKNGGSIPVGGSEDVQRFWDWYWQTPSIATFADQESFYDAFKDPLRMYTGGGVAEYGINIIDSYQFDYLPQQPPAIFH